MKKIILLLIVNYSLLIPSARDCFAQWLQQTLPVSGLVYDISFFDANTGLVSMDTPALLRTTNGGVNWNVIADFRCFHLEKIDINTLYATGRRGISDMIYRTTNTGINWDSVSISTWSYSSMSFINKDI